jgi:hypothetical protein
VVRFVPYLRDTMNMRSASVVMAADFVKVLLETGNPDKAPLRAVIDSALMRADEPGEMLAYWRSTYSRGLPKPVKRGVADAVVRLYNERAALKYDGTEQVWRMADVIETVHPEPKAEWQASLFKYLIDKRHKREDISVENLAMLEQARILEAVPTDERREYLRNGPSVFQEAGFTWERLSGWLQGPMDAQAWETIIPSMGYMALLRNLRNFDEAKVSFATKQAVIAKLADPEQVAKSRQLPLRFYSAWHNARGLDWAGALESALNQSVGNVPSLKGKTLVLVDVSGSMNAGMSDRSKAQRWELAALFGSALALRAEAADLFAYNTESHRIGFHAGDSVLRTVDAIRPRIGGGTDTLGVIQRRYADQKPDRIVVLTDEQAWGGQRISWARTSLGDQTAIESIMVPIYTFNLAGYRHGHLPSGERNRFTFGGLTDQGFKAIELLEAGTSQSWPF